MKRLQRTYKVELKPTNQQIQKINQSLGVCRWLYNAYLAKNQSLYQDFKEGKLDKKKAFMSANEFDKYINNDVKFLDDYKWINDCGSKARKKAICNAELAYKKFFKGEAQFPRFKKKGKSKVGLYFPKNNKTDFKIERHKINIPTLKWVRLKEFGYIPTNAKVISGTVTEQAGKYYISIVCEVEEVKNSLPKTEPLGLDLGIKDFAIISNEVVKKNINKTSRVKKLEKKLKREQVRLSRKYDCLKNQNKIRKGETTRQNIRKQIVKVQRLHQRLRWYPSSKLCSCCGNVKKDLKLSDRIYVCKECGLVIDRDLQASINLREAKTYKIA